MLILVPSEERDTSEERENPSPKSRYYGGFTDALY